MSRTKSAIPDIIRNHNLWLACEVGDLQIKTVKELVGKGANVNHINRRDDYGPTPLHSAVQGKNPQCVSYLLSKGANPNIGNFLGLTPIALALQFRQIECFNILAAHKSTDVNLRVGEGDLVVSRIREPILDDDDDDDIPDVKYRAPLIEAVYSSRGNPDSSKLLLGLGAHGGTTDYRGDTPLHVAASYGYDHIVNLLLQHEYAATPENPNGVSIDAIDIEGCTALISACQNGKERIVKLLVAAGAKIDIKDQTQKTAIDYAQTSFIENFKKNIVTFLKKNRALQEKLPFAKVISSIKNVEDAKTRKQIASMKVLQNPDLTRVIGSYLGGRRRKTRKSKV